MLLQDQETGTLIKVLDTDALSNPVEQTIQAQVQEGQEEQDPRSFSKGTLVFPSGESLPRCWLDSNYRK